jgi:hypothetical protein
VLGRRVTTERSLQNTGLLDLPLRLLRLLRLRLRPSVSAYRYRYE